MNWLPVLGAVFVVVLVFFLAWLIPQMIGRSFGYNAKGRNITVLERLPVGRDAYILLVKVFDKLLVVGVTAGSMTTLGEEEAGLIQPGEEAQQGFQDFFKNALGNMPENPLTKALGRLGGGKKGGKDER